MFELAISDQAETPEYFRLEGVTNARWSIACQAPQPSGPGQEGWRAGLGSAGLRMVGLQMDGSFKDGTADVLLQAAMWQGSLAQCRLRFRNGDVAEGVFAISRYEQVSGGPGETRFILEMQNAGEVIYIAA